MKNGLILEGGAMRGMFTAGVMDVFLENDIVFDGAIGVSAGATFGCNYKSKQIGRVIRYNTAYCRDKRYCSIRSLIKTGDLYGVDFCYHELPEKLDIFDNDAFESNPMEFYVVCTDVKTGKPVYHKCDKADSDFLEWVRASASMPVVSRIVEVGGYSMLDGGISDSVPIQFFESIGYDRNVIILTQPEGYVKKKMAVMPAIRALMKKYPEVIKVLADRHEAYNETMKYIREKEEKGEVIVICPESALKVGKAEHNPNKLREAYESGRKVALRRLEDVKKFIAK